MGDGPESASPDVGALDPDIGGPDDPEVPVAVPLVPVVTESPAFPDEDPSTIPDSTSSPDPMPDDNPASPLFSAGEISPPHAVMNIKPTANPYSLRIFEKLHRRRTRRHGILETALAHATTEQPVRYLGVRIALVTRSN